MHTLRTGSAVYEILRIPLNRTFPDRVCASILLLEVYANPSEDGIRGGSALWRSTFSPQAAFNCDLVGKVSHRTQEGLASWQPNAPPPSPAGARVPEDPVRANPAFNSPGGRSTARRTVI